MSTKPNKALIEHICTLLNSDSSHPRARWAIAIAHHNDLDTSCTIEELDELMSADAETVGGWLTYLADGENIEVFTGNTDLFTAVKDEEAAEQAADAPFMASIEVAGVHYIYDWSDVAENLNHLGVVTHDDYAAGQWESYASNLLG